MPDGHNWNQLHRFLLNDGFRQIIDQKGGILSYHNNENDKIIVFKKSNYMSCAYLEKILTYLGTTYDEFKLGYEGAY